MMTTTTTPEQLDTLTAAMTAYPTFAALVGARNTPTLRVDLGAGELADAYDAYQAARGDWRRAFRG